MGRKNPWTTVTTERATSYLPIHRRIDSFFDVRTYRTAKKNLVGRVSLLKEALLFIRILLKQLPGCDSYRHCTVASKQAKYVSLRFLANNLRANKYFSRRSDLTKIRQRAARIYTSFLRDISYKYVVRHPSQDRYVFGIFAMYRYVIFSHKWEVSRSRSFF